MNELCKIIYLVSVKVEFDVWLSLELYTLIFVLYYVCRATCHWSSRIKKQLPGTILWLGIFKIIAHSLAFGLLFPPVSLYTLLSFCFILKSDLKN